MTSRRFLLTVVLLLLFGCSRTPAGPAASFDRTDVPFGTVDQSEQVEGVFQLTNEGDQPLEIGDLEVSCGCTSAVASKESLAPGETAQILVTFDTRLMHGDYRQEVLVHSNAADSPHRLTLTGTVVGWIVREPTSLLFAGPGTQHVTFWSPREGFSFTMTEIQAPPGVEVGEPEPVERGLRYPVTWTGKGGQERQTVQFFTDVEATPWIPIPVVYRKP